LIGLTDSKDVDSRRRKLNQQLADRLQIPLLSDIDQALQRPDVHIASICAEPYRRGRLIVQAARAGKHLYLDKPLAGSLADADAIVTAVRESGVVAQMFSFVHTGHVARIRNILHSGRLGQLLAIHCDHCFAKGQAGTASLGKPRDERAVPERYEQADAKRELTNVGVYPLVMILSLLRQRVCRVFATTGNYFFAEHQSRDMEDFGQVLLQLENGVIATCTTGRTGWCSHRAAGLNRVTLVGSETSAVVDADQPRAEVWSDAAPWHPPPRNPEDPMGMWVPPSSGPFVCRPKEDWLSPAPFSCVDDVAPFLDCVQSSEQCDIDTHIAAQATEILLAAYRSAAEQRTVALPLPRDTWSVS
jgi:predicted dehydrogenase